MKKTLLLLALLPATLMATMPGLPSKHAVTYKVDAAKSKVEWYAEKVTGKHNGVVTIKSGEVNNDHGKLSGTFAIDMTTITVTDLEGGMQGKLEGHLKSDDFFAVEKNPTATFIMTSVAPLADVKAGEPNFNVTGKLTIKGITNDVTFPAMIRFEGNTMTAKGDVKIDRTKYDIRYGSKTFFSDIGDKAIYDEFTIKLDIVAGM
ncbi:MAG: YceI family protein [Bacteroidetes bacterium]|nr:YceI family protein [Bacteroidota bacterium]